MRGLFLVSFWVVLAVPAFADPGASDVRVGNDLYRRGQFQEALEHYQKAAEKAPDDPRIAYDLGAAAYSAGDHQAAIGHFQKALLSDDDKMKRDAHFNLGDAFYRSGLGLEDKNVDQAIKHLESSLGSFEKARGVDRDDLQAAENYEFVKKEIERLKQKQQQQKQQQQKQQQQGKDQQQDQQQKQNEQDQQQQAQQQKQDEHKQGQEPQDPQQNDQPPGQDQEQDEQQGRPQEKNDPQAQGDQRPDQDKKEAPSGQNDEGQILSQQDANAKLDDFERNELPKGFLNFFRSSEQPRAVEKDW